MTQPAQPPTEPGIEVQAAIGLADTPAGQKVAVMLTVLCGKDAAISLADAIKQIAGQMSSSGLIVASPGTPPPNGVGHQT